MKAVGSPESKRDYSYEKLYERVRNRPAMFFGSTGINGLHNAVMEVINICRENNRKNIALSLNGSDIAILHDGEELTCSWLLDAVKASCKSFVYKNNQYKFQFDPQLFDTIEPNADALFDRLRELAFLNKHLIIEFNGYKLHYKNGLLDYYYYQNAKGLFWHADNQPISFSVTTEDAELDVVFVKAYALNSTVFSFVNNCRTIENGVHVDGFMKGLKLELRKYKQYSCEHFTGLKDSDVGLFIHVRIPRPEYYGSTKRKLTNPEIHEFVMQETRKSLALIFTETPGLAYKFVKCWRCRS